MLHTNEGVAVRRTKVWLSYCGWLGLLFACGAAYAWSATSWSGPDHCSLCSTTRAILTKDGAASTVWSDSGKPSGDRANCRDPGTEPTDYDDFYDIPGQTNTYLTARSRFAASWKPKVEYRSLNLPASWETTRWPGVGKAVPTAVRGPAAGPGQPGPLRASRRSFSGSSLRLPG